LSIHDGADVWSFRAAGPIHAPFIAAGRVHVADGDGVIHALALADGTELWTTTEPLKSPSDLAVLDDRLYVGGADGLVAAFDARTGRLLWQREVATRGTAVHAPAVTGQTLLAATDDAQLVALDTTTGDERWRRDIASAGLGTPVAWKGFAYVGAGPSQQTGRLVAYDLGSGVERWTVDRNIYSPSISGDVGYAGSADGIATAYDLATGAELWTVTFAGIVRPPVAAGDIVYLGIDLDRRVVALDRATGGELWDVALDGDDPSGIAVAQGLVVAGTTAGSVYAIEGDEARLTVRPPPSHPSVASRPTIATPSALATATPTATAPPLLPRLAWTAKSTAADFVPWSLAQAPDGRLWAAEGLSNRFSIFTADGRFVEQWGTAGSGDGQLDLTRANGDAYGNVVFGRDGTFYVLDVGNRRVQRFDAKRRFVSAWGGFGQGPGQFTDPVGLALDRDGNINVLDDDRGVIETYTPNGTVVRTISAFPPSTTPNDGANQLAIGPNDHLYVSLISPNEVIELDRTGSLIATYGGPGSGPGAFAEQPGALGFDRAGRLYVTQGPQRGDAPGVEIFAPDGRFLGGFGPLGSADGDLGFPAGLVVATDGIYVPDAGGLPDFGYRSLIRKFEPIDFP
jgi:outer membrane protein assembly factor BamB